MNGSNRLAMAALLAGVAALAVAALALGYAFATPHAGSGTWESGRGHGPMMGGGNYGQMMGGNYGPMMGGQGWWASPAAPQPGSTGFVPGTAASPRVVRILAGPGDSFYPSTITVVRGETVNFLVTVRGPVVHEFMVGPADAVAADREGTPEISGIGMMQTKSLTYTFDGLGPYAYACHEPGHYEAGMRGTILLVG